MDQNQALSVLVQAVNVAQSRGAYSLKEAGTIAQAVAVFSTEEDDDENVVNASSEVVNNEETNETDDTNE